MAWECAISSKFMDGIPVPAELKYIPSIPTSRKAEPPINISVNFMAAYSFLPLPQTPISKYMGISATS